MSLIGDLPSTQLEFEERFSTEAACLEYLRRQRWPGGFRCPKMRRNRGWGLAQPAARSVRELRTPGLPHGRHRVPRHAQALRLWFRVVGQFLLGKAAARRWTSRGSTGSSTRQRGPGCTSCAAAWRSSAALRSRGSTLALRFRPAERRARFAPQDRRATELPPSAKAGLPSRARSGRRRLEERDQAAAQINLHRVFSLLRRWLLGTYRGAAHPIHLQSYLDEFVFRFNRRRSANRWLLFQRLLERTFIRPPTYATLAGQPPLSMVAA